MAPHQETLYYSTFRMLCSVSGSEWFYSGLDSTVCNIKTITNTPCPLNDLGMQMVNHTLCTSCKDFKWVCLFCLMSVLCCSQSGLIRCLNVTMFCMSNSRSRRWMKLILEPSNLMEHVHVFPLFVHVQYVCNHLTDIHGLMIYSCVY